MDQRAARLRNALMRQDHFWPISQWPDYMQGYAVQEHRSNYERFRYFQFLVANGLPTQIARTWVFAADYRNGSFVAGNYDQKAHQQLDQLSRQHADGSLYTAKTAYFDMVMGRVHKVA